MANLNSTTGVRFFVTKRSVRDHLKILIERYRKKMNDEEKSTGVSPELTELGQALAYIIEMEEAAFTSQAIDEALRKEKADTDKQKEENVRKMAMEKLSETHTRAAEEGEQESHKKKRRSGNETISILREKAESAEALREEDLAMRGKQQKLEKKKLVCYIDQQKSMMDLIRQQQQQSQVLMAVVEKLVNKNIYIPLSRSVFCCLPLHVVICCINSFVFFGDCDF